MTSNRVYGIDLGTTYSCISYVDEHGRPVVIPNTEGELTTPSVVYFESPENVVVGNTAKDEAPMHPDRCVSAVKRLMGNENAEFSFDGKTYTPQEVSAQILLKVVRDVEVQTGDKVTDVVITCPAYFGVNQKAATEQAGRLAGLNVRYVIPEPTAAAIAYGMDAESDQVVMVYDLGGGTFDVTIIEIKAKSISVICTGGDDALGGKDWDATIAEYFAQEFEAQTGTKAASLLDSSGETFQSLMLLAEKCKRKLTSALAVTEMITHDTDKVKVELTRETLNRLTSNLLERTVSAAEQVLSIAKDRGFAKIDRILLVGGSSFMPQIMERLKARFAMDIRLFKPNESVAMGAAIFGHKCSLEDEVKRLLGVAMGRSVDDISATEIPKEKLEKALATVAEQHGLTLGGLRATVGKEINNVTSKSFGIKVWNEAEGQEQIQNLILVDDRVPVDVRAEFGTKDPDQIEVALDIYENMVRNKKPFDVALCASTDLRGSGVLKFGRPLPKGSPLEVIFRLARDGCLSVWGKDLTTNAEFKGEFQTSCILTVEEEEKARSRALAMKQN